MRRAFSLRLSIFGSHQIAFIASKPPRMCSATLDFATYTFPIDWPARNRWVGPHALAGFLFALTLHCVRIPPPAAYKLQRSAIAGSACPPPCC